MQTGFFCDLATCAVDCKPGFLPQGQSRTHCREFKGKLAWTKTLGDCGSCSHPIFEDDRIFPFCWVDKTTDRKICNLKCGDGRSDLKGLKRGDIRCGCGKSGCQWQKGKGKKAANLKKMTCIPMKNRMMREKQECGDKPPGCFDIWEDFSIVKTWSCKGCFLIKAAFQTPHFFDNRDHVEIKLSQKIKFLQWTFPIKHITQINEDDAWKIEFSLNGDMLTATKQGALKMTFLIEGVSAGRKPEIVSAKGCPC